MSKFLIRFLYLLFVLNALNNSHAFPEISEDVIIWRKLGTTLLLKDSIFSSVDYLELRQEFLAKGDKIADEDEINRLIKVYSQFHPDQPPFSLYGIPINQLIGKITCRTLIECTNDEAVKQLLSDQAEAFKKWTSGLDASAKIRAFDPFCGSGNALFGVVKSLQDDFGKKCDGIGWDNSLTIAECSSSSLESVMDPKPSIKIMCQDFANLGTSYSSVGLDAHVLFISPPWGEAVNDHGELDLTKTHPPIGSIIDQWKTTTDKANTLYCIQTPKRIVEMSWMETCATHGLEILTRGSTSITCTNTSEYMHAAA